MHRLHLLINGEYTEQYYCRKHDMWWYYDCEENCCEQEMEDENAEKISLLY